MEADLVGATSYRPSLNQIPARTGGNNPKCGLGFFSRYVQLHATVVALNRRDGIPTNPRLFRRPLIGDSQIDFFHPTLFKKVGVGSRCTRTLGKEENSRRFSVQSMDVLESG